LAAEITARKGKGDNVAKMNVTNIVLGTLSTSLGAVGEMLADKKVTVGEVWETTMAIGASIIHAIPGAADVKVYRIKHWHTVGNLMEAIDKTVAMGLSEFGVDSIVIGRTK
jgi:hypothetical protein|tara:strand:- start:25 stop:357 length:333 start_codon:yes stop_codon:yes gene_type:complete